MQFKDAIRFALDLSHRAVLGEIDKVGDAVTTYPTPNGGCHPMWVVGHLAVVEGLIPMVLYGEPHSLPEWFPLFGEHTQPVADAALYPPFAEVRARYEALRARNLQILESLSDTDLDQPTKAPPQGREREFATFGSSLLTLAVHQAMHRGHVTDAIRAAGQRVHSAQSAR